jgi:hypothetical protein
LLYKIISIFAASVLLLNLSGQTSPEEIKTVGSDSSSHLSLKEQLVPASLISAGILIEALNIKEEIQEWFPRTNTNIENYLRDVPVVMLYAADVSGFRHRNSAFNQTKFLIISRLTTGFLTQYIKLLTNVTRPNGKSYAFPSGHTSEAFTSAAVLYNETIDYNPWLAYSGYLFATATGILRITNNWHWISDVLVGAGLGMLVANIVYYFEPFKNWDPFRHKSKAEIIPDIDLGPGTYSFSVRVLLR